MELYNLRVNHVKEALGFFLGEKPTVSFQVKDTTYGKKLKSVTITVADNEKMEMPIYCISGEISEEMTAYPIQTAFSPRTIYYYQVKAVSDTGEEASAVSWFETGKMHDGWNAKWITPEEMICGWNSKEMTESFHICMPSEWADRSNVCSKRPIVEDRYARSQYLQKAFTTNQNYIYE